MLKKILKITGISLLVILLALAVAPFLFKDKIKEIIAKTLNESVNAKVAFEEVDLSLLKGFPNATISINKLSIINKAPFEGDTLFYSNETNLKMSISELFNKASEPMNLQSISAENAVVNIIFNKEGIGNYDIAIKEVETTSTTQEKPFALKIENYAIENLKFTYLDKSSNMKMILDSINHEGTGNFAAQKLDLNTKTTAKLSFDMDKTNFMKNTNISLDAVLGIDMEKMKFEFKENKALINQLPLEFDGFLQMLEAGQLYEITFKTPTSSFKNFLGLIPEAYSGDLNKVETSGDFVVKGKVNGTLSETTIPKFDVQIASKNAMFKYPDLPKAVKNIVIDTHIVNETGLMNDTFINLNNLSFSIDQDVFKAKATVRNFENALVNAALKGTINLNNFSKAYPISLDTPLSGILKADVVTKFDMKSVETSQYQNIQNSGTMSLAGFKYVGPEMAKPFLINKADISFNTSKIVLNQFDAKTGNSDLNVKGTLENFYGFLFKNQVLKGNFFMNSYNLVVTDFMQPTTVTKPATASKTSTNTTAKTNEVVKIPSFLDCSITATAKTVVYDNLNLKEVSGNLLIKDEAISLNNLKMNIFDGSIGLNGMVSTKGNVPNFKMDLGLNQVNIAESFTYLDMLKSIAPIAGVINGKLNSTIKFSGNLKNDMTPDLKTLSGDLIGQLLSTTINDKNSKLLSSITSNMNFIKLDKLNLNDVKAALNFENGKVTVKPITIKHQDINATISGTHSFDQNMNYDLKFDVPTKYLGSQVTSLISKLTPSDATKIESIPVNGILSGSFNAPKFSTDIKSATTNLVSQLAKQQKDKLVGQGTNALNGLINKKSSDTTKKSIPTTKEEVKEEAKTKATNAIKDGLNSLLKKKKE